QPEIEHRGPEIRDLFVADSLFAGHVCACDQTLLARVLPMRLPAHPAHDAVRIKRQIAHRENSFLFGLEIFCDWRTVWSGERRVADKIEIRFCAAAHYRQTVRHAIAAFGLNIS